MDQSIDIISTTPDDIEKNPNLRPKKLGDFTGQKKNVQNLETYILAAKKRNESLDHVLISGPPGLGKTTLANIIANELDQELIATSAPSLEKTGDLAAILTSLTPKSILFIDEIHRLKPVLEEILYSAMEDFQIDVIIGQGPGAKTIKIDLQPFTLIGATTRPGMLSAPLQNRFGIDIHMDFYTNEDLLSILEKKASMLQLKIEKKASEEISKRSRGTPRILQKLLRRVWDFSLVKEEKTISLETVNNAMEAMQINESGLTKNDVRLISIIFNNYNGGPVGLSTLAIALGDSEDSIEDIYEPFLIREGFIQKTPRGRILTNKAYSYFHLQKQQNDENLFN